MFSKSTIEIKDRMIKVGRPSNIGQAKPIIEQMMQESQKYHRFVFKNKYKYNLNKILPILVN